MRWFHLLAPIVLALTFPACQSTYYATMESFGIEKRDILVDRVEKARDAQEDTKETFRSSLEEFSNLIDFDGGELEDLYDRLRDSLEDSQKAAANVSDRIARIEQVGGALFREWEKELDDYSNDQLRRESERQLRETRSRYTDLLTAMRRAESRMPPVLEAFQDRVLFLKHNLNAQAVASLENESIEIRDTVAALISEMEAAIDEANAFIDAMR